MNWFGFVSGLLPLILGALPGMPALLVPIIIQGINEAEQIKGATGPEKKAHVLALVTLAITTVNTTAKRTVIDAAQVMPIIERAIDTGIAIVNLLAKHH